MEEEKSEFFSRNKTSDSFFSLLQLEKTRLVKCEGDWNIITLYSYYYLNLKTIFIICVFLYSVWKWLKASINMVNQIDFLVWLNTENFSPRQTNIKFSQTEQTSSKISTSLWIGLLKMCRQARSKAMYFPSRNWKVAREITVICKVNSPIFLHL